MESSFEPPVSLETGRVSHGYTISVSGNSIYVLWRDEPFGSNHTENDIFFIGSTDNGNTFGEPIRLTNTTKGSPGVDKLGMAASGNNVYVIYLDYLGSSGRDPILFRSTDNGATFSSPIKISTNTEGKLNIVIAGLKAVSI